MHKRLDIKVNKRVEHKSCHLGIPVQESRYDKPFIVLIIFWTGM